MADWSMEPAAAWVPCDLQLANWTTGYAVCSAGLPVEYASSEMFGNCLQTSVPVSEGGQLVEYALASEYDPVETTTSEQEFVVDFYNMEKIIRDPNRVFKEAADEFRIDIGMMGRKIHRYPASIQALRLSDRYTVPMVVSIGPYHHGLGHLKRTEMVKHAAAFNCIRISGLIPQELYDEVVQAAHCARSLYDHDVAAGMSDDDYLPMMFLDACFLVQYMLSMCSTSTSAKVDDSLCSFFDSNDNEIFHDIMLLENQLPWSVVRAIMEFVPVPLEEFISPLKDCLQDRKKDNEDSIGNEKVSIGNYEPPHLLGLLRFFIVEENRAQPEPDTAIGTKSISFSVSAVELAEIGVTLKPSETTELAHMALKTTGTLFAELSLAPLSLDSSRASYLINMAALELCTTSNFRDVKEEESAVCSYLLLLAMLVSREEDVQELRTRRLLQGGGGLNNRDALDFFTTVQGLRLGHCYVRIMVDIEKYRDKRRTRTSVHAFFYKNCRIITAVLSAIVTLVSILGTLLSLRNS